jgi:hypothetical protein
MIAHDIPQNSDRWLRLRAGIVTASNVHKIITPKTLKLSEQHKGYMARLLLEWVIGRPILDEDETLWMRMGSDLQDKYLRAYSFQTGVEVSAAGFYTTDDGLVGASPDGLALNAPGLVELKGRKPELHLASMLWQDDFISSHAPQVQTQLYVDDSREWDDLNCFPLTDSPIPAFTCRRYRDPKWQAALGPVFRQFTDALLEKRLWLEREYGPFERPSNEQTAAVIGSLGVTDEDVDAILAARGQQ